GIDLQKRDMETPSRPSYLRGEFREGGWPWYYLYGLLIKVPLGAWALAGMALLASAFISDYRASWRDEFMLLLPIASLLALASSQPFTNHVRYVLPVLPLGFVWMSKAAKALGRRDRVLRIGVCLALTWFVASSLQVYPHSLSYFNELAGGPRGGMRHLSNSNIDWGQDLFYLKRWIQRHPEARPLHVAYYGPLDPSLVNINCPLPPDGPDLPQELQPGWYVVSVNFLQGYPYPVYDRGKRVPKTLSNYAYFQQFEPFDSAGHSIYIYHISQADRDALSRQRFFSDFSGAGVGWRGGTFSAPGGHGNWLVSPGNS
ncbi:MAG: hypothetical protein KY475_26280, partial [Planctomycetes bacterium]|nr:hypothetical protein [Planctomycetota bacterium]